VAITIPFRRQILSLRPSLRHNNIEPELNLLAEDSHTHNPYSGGRHRPIVSVTAVIFETSSAKDCP
jgi:hypothetical protein